MNMLPPIRRIVTSNRADGSSYLAEDGSVAKIRTAPSRPGMQVSEVWTTLASPVDIGQPDATRDIKGLLPPKNGTLFRIIDFPAEHPDPAEHARIVRESFAQLYPDYDGGHLADHKPGSHRTISVDYAVVLQGEIVAVVDEGETVMRVGDVLIQRGTNHGWRNRSGAICRMLFVLVDGIEQP